MNGKLTSQTQRLCSVTFRVWLTELHFVAPFSRRQTLREPFNATSLLLTERKKKLFFVYIDTQCRFMEGPKVRQRLWESRAELLLAFVIGETSNSEEPLSAGSRAWASEGFSSLRRGFTTRDDGECFLLLIQGRLLAISNKMTNCVFTDSQRVKVFSECNPWILVTEHCCGRAHLKECKKLQHWES